MAVENYPECERLASFGDAAFTIYEFLEWLDMNHFSIHEHEEYEFVDMGGEKTMKRRWIPTRKSNEELAHLFFGIDRKKLEQERKAILLAVRNKQPETTP